MTPRTWYVNPLTRSPGPSDATGSLQSNPPSSAQKRGRSPSPNGRALVAGAAGVGAGGGGSPSSSAPPSSLPGSSPPAGFSDIDDDGVEENDVRTDEEGDGDGVEDGEDLFGDNLNE